MSIRDELAARLSERRLFRVEPALPGQPEPRVLYATELFHAELVGPWDDLSAAAGNRIGRLRGDLDIFITGGLITVGGPRHKHAYMKPLDPETNEVWEIRSRDPTPNLRVFGRFAEQDVFVGTHLERRDKLGGYGSEEFKAEIRRCKVEWRKLFPTYQPLRGSSVHDYISENVFDLRSLG